MKIRTSTYEPTALFEIKIPLQNSKRFQLYHLQPIPTPINGSLMSIQPSTEYFIVNLQRDMYYPLQEIELLRCNKRQSSTFACQLKHPLYKPSSGKSICELNLLKHQGMKDCIIKRQEISPLWSEFTSTNTWIYVATNPLTIDIICDKQIHTQMLEGAGLIQFYE